MDATKTSVEGLPVHVSYSRSNTPGPARNRRHGDRGLLTGAKSAQPNIDRLRQRMRSKHDRFDCLSADILLLKGSIDTITASKAGAPSTSLSMSRVAILIVCLLLMICGFCYQFLQFMRITSVSPADLLLLNQFLVISVVFFTGGLLKGISGIGMGLIAVPLMAILYSPLLAVALVALPMVATNFHQGVIAGDIRKSLKTHLPLAAGMSLAMAVTSQYAHLISNDLIQWAIGLTAIVFVLFSIVNLGPVVPDRYDQPAQWATGIVAGVVGGVTGLVVIPLVLYMMLRNLDKEESVSLSGFLLLLSGIALLFGHFLNGVMTKEIFILSVIAAAPAVIGTLLGERIRYRVSETKFRNLLLLLIFVIGLKTIMATP